MALGMGAYETSDQNQSKTLGLIKFQFLARYLIFYCFRAACMAARQCGFFTPHMEVSWNGGTPNHFMPFSSFFTVNHPFGRTPIYENLHMSFIVSKSSTSSGNTCIFLISTEPPPVSCFESQFGWKGAWHLGQFRWKKGDAPPSYVYCFITTMN